MVGRHENIVNLLGVCSQPLGEPLLVVLEFAQLGNLREFVQVYPSHVDTVTSFIFEQKRRLPGELCFKQMLVNITQVLNQYTRFGKIFIVSLRWRVGWSILQVDIASTGFPRRYMIQVYQ